MITKYFILALREYNAYLVFNKKKNHGSIDESIKKKLLQRCNIVIKYLTNIQTSILSIMEDKSCKLIFIIKNEILYIIHLNISIKHLKCSII